MNRALGITILACSIAVALADAQTVFAQSPLDEEFVVIRAGKVITISGDEIDDGEIVIVDGVIRLVGKQLEYPASATVIDAPDQVVMPGMVHAHSRANLPVFSRSGVQTHRSVTEEVYLDEIDFEPFLREGFTAVALVPPGSGMPGMSAVYRTAGGEGEEDLAEFRLLNREPFLRVSFDRPGSHKPALRNALKKAEAEIEKVEKARKEWEEKQKKAEQEQRQNPEQEDESDGGEEPKSNNEDEDENNEEQAEEEPAEFKPPEIDRAHKRIVDLIQEEADYPMMLELSSAADVLHARDVIEPYEQIDWVWYLQTGFRSDYNYIAQELGAQNATVMLTPIVRAIPNTYDLYNLPAELLRHGCTVAFVPGGLRAYRTLIADAVRAGLPRREALEAVTITPARIAGIDDRFGTIERGKEADLIFLDGDPLNPLAKVTRVMVHGEVVWEEEE